MATILVTGVGGPCGIGAVKSLRTATSHEIIGVDMNSRAAGIRLADGGTSVPAATDETWPDAMASVAAEFDVDVIIPTVDEELAVLESLTHRLPEETSVIAPTQDVIDLALDKYHTMERLSAAGHPTPDTWLPTDSDRIDSASFPLIIKPRRGRGSRGIQRVGDHEELDKQVAESEYAPDELLCQEIIEGTEYTTSVVVTDSNRLLSTVPKEAIEKEGSTVLGATRRAPAVANECAEIFDTVKPAGPLNIQQIVDEDGVPRTIEINPRFSSTSCLTAKAGVDEFDLLIDDALGREVKPVKDFETDLYILRYQSHLYCDADELDDSASQSAPAEPLENRL